jgi:hypothetical protein
MLIINSNTVIATSLWVFLVLLVVLIVQRGRCLGWVYKAPFMIITIGLILVLVGSILMGGIFVLIDLLIFIDEHSMFLLSVFSFSLAIFFAWRKTWPWWVRGACLGMIAAFLAFEVFLPQQRYEQIKAERLAYEQKAFAYFHEQCAKDSGLFVYKPVETQESVYIMKPRRRASRKDLKNQFWMGDPYMGAKYHHFWQSGSEKFDPPVELEQYIGSGDERNDVASRVPYFSFVEMPDMDDQTKMWRYIYEPTGRMKETQLIIRAGKAVSARNPEVMKYPEKILTRVPINTFQSRYGFTWDDLSTPEGRQYWVAKSRLQIIDLQNHEVIAERVGYLIEGRSFGTGEYGWHEPFGGDNTGRFFCPSSGRNEDWIRSVLLNVPFK